MNIIKHYRMYDFSITCASVLPGCIQDTSNIPNGSPINFEELEDLEDL